MKLGLVSPADDNLYAATLLAALAASGDTPCLVISTHRSRFARAMAYVGQHGWRAFFRRLLEEADLAEAGPASVRRCLQALSASRGFQDWDRPLSRSCQVMGIEYLHASSVNAPVAVEAVRRNRVDVLLSAVAELYRSPMIEAPTIGILNAHMALLPRFRGMNALEWSVLLGQTIGVTIHFVAHRVDTGAIVLRRAMEVAPGDTLDTLRARSMAVNVELMIEAVSSLKADPAGRREPCAGEGQQYFVMHARLKEIVRQKISTGSVSTGR
ncbi:MAG: hypothetical protein KA354_20115 [Phycisphaerae bacterium]|nr:hypothetical protein [Phycisphaerae bacterium]